MSGKLLNSILDEIRKIQNLTGAGGVSIGKTPFGYTIHGSADSFLKEGTLDGNLSKPNSHDNETTATLSVYNLDSGSWTDSGANVTVTNRDTSLSASTGDYVIAMLLNNEWRPIWVSC